MFIQNLTLNKFNSQYALYSNNQQVKANTFVQPSFSGNLISQYLDNVAKVNSVAVNNSTPYTTRN